MAELLGRRALFAGKDQYDQLRRIVRICGSPSHEDLSFLDKETQDTNGGKQASKRRMRINKQFIEQLPSSEVRSQGRMQAHMVDHIYMYAFEK